MQFEIESKTSEIIGNDKPIILSCRLEEDWPVEFVSENITRFGYTPDDLVSKHVLYPDIIHKDDFDRIKNELYKNYKEGIQNFTQKYRILTKSGDVRWVYGIVSINTEESGVSNYQSSIFDITEILESEQHIKNKMEIKDTLLEISSLLIAPDDIDSTIDLSLEKIGTLCNASRSYIFLFRENENIMDNTHEWCAEGVDPQKDNLQELPNDMFPWWMHKLNKNEIIHITDVSAMPAQAEAEQNILEMQDIKSLLVFPLYTSKGLMGYIGLDNISNKGQWIKEDINSLGTIAGIMGMAIERYRVEQDLWKKTHNLNERIKELNCLYEISKIIEENLPLEEISQRIVDIIPPSWQYPEIACARLILDNKAFQTTNFRETVWKQSSDIIVNGKSYGNLEVCYLEERPDIDEGPFLNEERALIDAISKRLGVLIERILSEKKMMRAKIEAEAANSLKTNFLANMSHELRTPLNSVIGFSDILLGKNFGHVNPKQEKYLRNISISGKHLLEIINSILDLSKIESGKSELQYTDIVVSDVIDEVRAILSPISSKKDIDIEYSVESGIKNIRADRNKFKQILYNLLSNAIKFTPSGGSIYINSKFSGDILQIDVIDTGIGISENDQKKLFQPFVQLDSSLSREYSGTGLGLSIVQEFVELHGGSIWLNSEIDNGTTFTFTIPTKEFVKQKQPDTNKVPDHSEKGIFDSIARNDLDHGISTDKRVAKSKINSPSEESCSTYMDIVENEDDAIIIVQDGLIKYANTKTAEFTGIKKNQLIGSPLLRYVLPEYRELVLHKYEQKMKNDIDRLLKCELELLSKYGVKIPVEANFSSIKYEENPAVVIRIRDVTERKQSEDILAEKIEAETANRTKSEFLASMSHELRTPLNSIIGFSDLLLSENFGDLNDKQSKYVGNVSISGKYLLDIINDILDLSKIEAGKLDLSYEEIDLLEIVGEVKTIVSSIASEKNITLNSQVDPHISKIIADKGKLKQILYNLVSNAVKFTPEEGSVDIVVQKIGNSLKIKVMDTGIGIPEEEIQNIFDTFYRLKSNPIHNCEGTGLGLAIVKQLAKLHGGDIQVESKVNRGTTFILSIPIRPEEYTIHEEMDFAGISTKKNKEDSCWKSKIVEPLGHEDTPLIMVVEDDAKSNELLTIILNEAGYSVTPAHSAKEALELMKVLEPVAITLDIMMPDTHGWDLFKKIKSQERTKDIPVIIISMVDEKRIGFEMGVFDYLVKPIDKNVLIKTLQKVERSFNDKNPKILVVDDDPVAIELMESIIEPQGFELIKAYGGQEGIEKTFHYRPDIIILDLMMPGTNGFDVISKLKEDPGTKDIPIIISTAKEITSEDLKQLKNSTEHIVKKRIHDGNDFLNDIRKIVNFAIEQ